MLIKILLSLLGLGLLTLAVLVINFLTAEAARPAVGQKRQLQPDSAPPVSYHALGEGGRALAVMIPSLGRRASDFNELAGALAEAGLRVLMIEPRPGGSDSASPEPTLFDLAEDARSAVSAERSADSQLQNAPLILIGHAFGNRVARAYSTRHPDEAAGIVLIAAGGKVAIAPKIRRALLRSFWTWMPDWWRQHSVRLAFFAPGNDIPPHWMGGWGISISQLQVKAVARTPSVEWWAGGSAPMLIVQGMQDTIAPSEHTAVLLKEEFGERVHIAEIDGAGHALLPEQPDLIRQAVLDFVAGIAPTS